MDGLHQVFFVGKKLFPNKKKTPRCKLVGLTCYQFKPVLTVPNTLKDARYRKSGNPCLNPGQKTEMASVELQIWTQLRSENRIRNFFYVYTFKKSAALRRRIDILRLQSYPKCILTARPQTDLTVCQCNPSPQSTSDLPGP